MRPTNRPRTIRAVAVTPRLAAIRAAQDAHDAILARTGCTATRTVHPEVQRAAEAAYRAAGGPSTRTVRVIGYGTRTHPVAFVGVRSTRA
jgi:hypothetical protein